MVSAVPPLFKAHVLTAFGFASTKSLPDLTHANVPDACKEPFVELIKSISTKPLDATVAVEEISRLIEAASNVVFDSNNARSSEYSSVRLKTAEKAPST